MFKIVKNYYDIELWRDGKFLKRFVNWEEMLQYVYDLDRYAPPEISQLKLEWNHD